MTTMGWIGLVYVARFDAVEGFRTVVSVDGGFIVRVFAPGSRVPVYSAGDEGELPVLDAAGLQAATDSCRVGPFAGTGAVDWTVERAAFDALVRVGGSQLATAS